MKFLKNILALVIALTAVLVLTVNVSAENSDKVVDNADILTDSEENELEKYILGIIEEHGRKYDIAVVTTYGTGGMSIEAFADDFYDHNGYGYGSAYSGIILAVDMESRHYQLSTCGEGITVFTDYGLEYIEDGFLSYLSSGNNAAAFCEYAECAGTLIEYYESHGKAYDVGVNRPKPRYFLYFVCALIFGSIIGFTVCMCMKNQLKSVNFQANAANYVRQGSFHVTNSRDMFLYRTVSRVKRETSSSGGSSGRSGGSSTHHSSSGRSHGGRGGSF